MSEKSAVEILYEHRYGYTTDNHGWEWAACQGCSWPEDDQMSRGAGYEPHYAHQANLIESVVREQVSSEILERRQDGDNTRARTLEFAAFIARGEHP